MSFESLMEHCLAFHLPRSTEELELHVSDEILIKSSHLFFQALMVVGYGGCRQADGRHRGLYDIIEINANLSNFRECSSPVKDELKT